MLWSFVHGHSFLTIDKKSKVASARIDDWTYLPCDPEAADPPLNCLSGGRTGAPQRLSPATTAFVEMQGVLDLDS